MSRLLADLVVVLHLGFVAFVLLGGLLTVRWPVIRWVHLPAAAWGVWIELSGGVCPLTPLEQLLRRRAGEAGYSGDFVAHYLLSVLYPRHLTRTTQLVLGAVVVGVNLAVYGWGRARRRRLKGPSPPTRARSAP